MIYQTYPWGGVYSKSEVNTLLNDYIPKAGGAVISGAIMAKTSNDSYATYCGGASFDNGASIRVHGKDYTDSYYAGTVLIRARKNSDFFDLFLKPDGTALWGNKNLAMQEDVVPRSGGMVMTGNCLGRNVNNDIFYLYGGTGWFQGALICLYGKDESSYTPTRAGAIQLRADNGSDSKEMLLYPNGTWLWDGTAVQLTSDQRLKQQISKIDNALLDAWEDVELVQFKYNDAVNEKGNQARLHTGYVVQQIDTACKSHNIDISKYGLYCHEEYQERTEEVTIENEDGTTSKETRVIEEASEHYSLRYTETLVVECAYLRRENSRLKERLSKIEKLLNI